MDPANTTTRFRGTMEGVRLLDIVQLCCRAASTCCLEVKNGRHGGSLWLVDGDIVHAESGDLSGEEAAMSILTWRYGSFALHNLTTSDRATITGSWEGLVMRAACVLDETAVPSTGRQAGSAEVAEPTEPARPQTNGATSARAAPTVSSSSSASENNQELQKVQLASHGEYVLGLARDVGMALDLGPPSAVYGRGTIRLFALEVDAEDGSARVSEGPLSTDASV